MIFGFAHLATSWKRPNKTAIRFGLALLAVALVILVSGLVLVRLGGFEVRDPRAREVGYWLHVLTPLAAVALYVKHRLAGPRIRWEWARRFSVAVAGFVVLMGLLALPRPSVVRRQGAQGRQAVLLSVGSRHRQRQVHPRAHPDDGRLLPEMPQRRLRRLVSFGPPLQLVQQQGVSRPACAKRGRVALERDGSTQAARWCAGCHDPVPFFSGEFDDPNYDDVHNPTSQAGITCTTCHAMTNVNNTRGNAAYTIEEPQHYPFAFSDDPLLQWINNALVKAKPEMHKKTFLKPIIKDIELLLDLPQGRPPVRRQPLQRLRPRAKPP